VGDHPAMSQHNSRRQIEGRGGWVYMLTAISGNHGFDWLPYTLGYEDVLNVLLLLETGRKVDMFLYLYRDH
jgi:hypothetical protein